VTQLEVDVARVRAVTAALVGLQKVWLVRWQNKYDHNVMIFASKQGAIDQLVEWLDAEWETDFGYTKRQYKILRNKLLKGAADSFDDDSARWISYSVWEVLP
jgi:hypothetical protein